MHWLLERPLHENSIGSKHFCASFARSTAHFIVKNQPESAHFIRTFTQGDVCQILNPLKGDELASRLHRNSVSPEGETALASQPDAICGI